MDIATVAVELTVRDMLMRRDAEEGLCFVRATAAHGDDMRECFVAVDVSDDSSVRRRLVRTAPFETQEFMENRLLYVVRKGEEDAEQLLFGHECVDVAVELLKEDFKISASVALCQTIEWFSALQL